MNRKLSLIVLCLISLCLYGQEVALPGGESALVNGSFTDKENPLNGWQCRTGDHGTFKITPAQDGSPDPVLTIDVKKMNPKPWVMELLQRVDKPVEKGCTMYITFEYKMSKGYSFQFYWQLETPPWHKLLSMRITSPENQWNRVRVAAPVHEMYQPQQTAFSFHLAEAPGVLQLRNIYGIIVPNDVNPESLDVNEAAVLGGDFYDREWRAKITDGIKKNRRVPLTVYVHRRRAKAKLSNNMPVVSDAIVMLHQTGRPFKTGFSGSAAVLYPELLEREEFADMKKHLGNYAAKLPEYRNQIIGNPMFKGFACTDAFVWKHYETWGKNYAERLAADMSAAGLELCGEALFCPRYDTMPPRYRGIGREELQAALLGQITAVTSSLSGKMAGWTVVADAVANTEVYNFLGVDSLPKSYAAARKGDEKAKMFLSDNQGLNVISEIPLQDAVELGGWLTQTCNTKLDGLVFDGSMKRLDVGPQTLEKRLDFIASNLPGVPVHIKNFAVNMNKDAQQSEMLRDYMLLFYSKPCVSSVSFGELWTAAAEIPAMAYINSDFQPRASWKMLKKLLLEEWVSHEELKTNHSGQVSCEVYGGSYDITVASGNTTKTFKLDIPDGYQLTELFGNHSAFADYTVSYQVKNGMILHLFLPEDK